MNYLVIHTNLYNLLNVFYLMSLEDYFQYYRRKERSPLEINYGTVAGDGIFYRIVVTDSRGISVRDSKNLKKEEIKEETKELVKALKDRGYSVNVFTQIN